MTITNQGGTARLRAVEAACAVVIFLSVSACGSDAGNAGDSASAGSGASSNGESGGSSGSSSSGGSGNGGSSDKAPDCGTRPLSTTRLPGKNVYQFRVAGGNVYYGEDAGID